MEERIDIGNMVLCDFCSTDFTDSDRCGGILFQSKAACPNCWRRVEANANKYGEERFIRGRCPEGMMFREWVLELRGGDNSIMIITADSE